MSGFQSPNYTQVPNDFFDMIPDMSDTELRVTLIMIRETIGYHRDAAKVGIAELGRRTGLSYNGAAAGCDSAGERKTFRRTNPEAKTQAEWELNIETPSASEGLSSKHPQPVRVTPSASEGQVGLNKDKEIKKEKDTLGSWIEISRKHAEQENQEKEILDSLERGLKINIKRDNKSANYASKIYKDGRPVERWIEWYRSDAFRMSSAPFMTVEKVWAMWPQAFSAENERVNVSVDGGMYV
jgi:hypothetical protein